MQLLLLLLLLPLRPGHKQAAPGATKATWINMCKCILLDQGLLVNPADSADPMPCYETLTQTLARAWINVMAGHRAYSASCWALCSH